MWLTELKKIGYDVVLFMSGMAGTFVLKRKDKDFKWWVFCLDLIAGGLVAMHLTPLFMLFLRVSEKVELAIAFCIGLLGYRAVDLVINFIINNFKKN